MKFTPHRIGDLCDMIRGESPIMKTEPGEYPLVVTAAYRRTSNAYQLEGPAVCVPLVSSTGHGDAALHRVHYQDGPFALANLLVALLPRDATVCNAKYLYYLLNTKKDEYFVPLMLGTANVSLKEKDIAGVEVPLPPLPEQQRIVAKVEELAGKIDEAKGLRQEIDAKHNALLRAAYHRIVENAPVYPLSEVAPLVRRPVSTRPDGEYAEIGIRSFGRGTFHKPMLLGTDLTWQKLFTVRGGDILFSNIKAWEGAIAVVRPDDDGRVGSHRYLTCVPITGKATATFVCFHLLSPIGLLAVNEASPGSADRNRTLGMEALQRIPIPTPSYEKQCWFDRIFQSIECVRSVETASAKQLDALLPSILDKAFKGEL